MKHIGAFGLEAVCIASFIQIEIAAAQVLIVHGRGWIGRIGAGSRLLLFHFCVSKRFENKTAFSIANVTRYAASAARYSFFVPTSRMPA